jgi:hypothetical protein
MKPSHYPSRLLALAAVTLMLASCSDPEADFNKAQQANTEQAFAAFLQEHPDSLLAARARASIEQIAFDEARKAGTAPAYQAFLQRFAEGNHAAAARAGLEQVEFGLAGKHDSGPGWRAFLAKYPSSTNAPAARNALAGLLLPEALAANDRKTYEAFLKEHSGTPAALQVHQRVEQLDYQSVTNTDDLAACEIFLASHPNSVFAPDVRQRLSRHLEVRDWNAALLKNTPEAFEVFKQQHPSSPRVLLTEITFKDPPKPTFFLFKTFAPADQFKVTRSCAAINGGIGIRLPPPSAESTAFYPIPLRDAMRWDLVETSPLSQGATLPGEFFMESGGGGNTGEGLVYNEGSTVKLGLGPPDEQGRRSQLFSVHQKIVGRAVQVTAVEEKGMYRVINIR